MPRRILSADLSSASPTKGAVLERVRQMLVVERVCSRFHRVAVQLQVRRAGRNPLILQDTVDVQDLLHALLLLDHEDVRVYERPISAGKDPPAHDFWLSVERMVIVSCLVDDGLIMTGLPTAVERWVDHYCQRTDCRTLVCFVYDPQQRLADPRRLEQDLSGERNGLAVRVLIAPVAERLPPTTGRNDV